MDFLTCHFSLIFFPFVSLRHHVLSYKLSKKKKKTPFGYSILCCPWRRTDSIWYFSWKARGQILSNGVATSSLLSEHTPSQKYALPAGSTKGADPALGVSKCPHPFLFLLRPVAWEWHKSLGNLYYRSMCGPLRPGSGLSLISCPPGPSSKPTVRRDCPKTQIWSWFFVPSN